MHMTKAADSPTTASDQPHLRKQRNLEVKRALQMFIENCVNIELVSK